MRGTIVKMLRRQAANAHPTDVRKRARYYRLLKAAWRKFNWRERTFWHAQAA